MSDQEKIRERIRHLLGRTTARGCTEAEAMEAAAKAAELMNAHGLAEGDIAFEECRSKTKVGLKSNRSQVWATIATCTSTSVMVQHKPDGDYVVFIGRAPGPEIAVYLRDVCDRAIDKEIAAFKAGTFYRRRRSLATKRAAVADFTVGIVTRMRIRLRRLFVETIATGGDAVKAADAEQKRRYPDTVKVKRPEHKSRYDDAMAEGYAAGARPQLAHGVGGTGSVPLQIGRLP